ncbi:MAG: RluA family pseudouridine synthase [Bacteroidales bacterium]|nr:RluA family pseudouridine synthase [Bacteroidales bacterium]
MAILNVRENTTLLPFLLESFPDRSRTSVKEMLSKGMVCIKGECIKAFDHPLKKGDKVEILPKGISVARAKKGDAVTALSKKGVKILHEDAHIIVVDKPSGLPTIDQSGKRSGGISLYRLLNEYLRVSAASARKEALISGAPVDRATPRIWIVHRIDKGTSGILLFAKDERTKDLLQSKWKEMVVERKYIAYAEGCIAEGGRIESYLKESDKSLKVTSFDAPSEGAKLAVTNYTPLQYIYKRGSSRTVLWTRTEFRLETGRKNQIRVHSALIGHPIAGDYKYGAATDPIGRLALHAATLVLRNPYGPNLLRFTSPLPEIFNRFE